MKKEFPKDLWVPFVGNFVCLTCVNKSCIAISVKYKKEGLKDVSLINARAW